MVAMGKLADGETRTVHVGPMRRSVTFSVVPSSVVATVRDTTREACCWIPYMAGLQTEQHRESQ
jgi:hypothetical protein